MHRQVTVLRNYYASGDSDELRFEKEDGTDRSSAWLREYYSYVNSDKKSKVYPQDLLPQEHNHKSGHWRITVEFIPTEEE